MDLLAQLFGVVDGGVQDFGRRFPATVQIAPSERTPIVTVDDAVRIEHGNDLEDEILSKQLGLVVVRIC